MHFLALLAIAAAPIAVTAQTVHQVVVGSSTGQTIFTPEAIFASPGDIVTFQFQQKNHSVVQSSFANPCGEVAGGFNSGYMPVAPDVTSDFPTFNVTVPDEKPIWVYCSQKNPVPHCGLGMVFAVNCGPSGSANSFDNFKAAALAQGAAFASSASAAGASSAAYGYGAPAAAAPTAAAPTDAAPGEAPPSTVTAAPDAQPSEVVATITLDSSTWTTTYASYPNSPNPTPVSLEGITHNVVVGGNGTLTFDPPHISASVRDTVIFTFMTKNHTVTQSTFGNPCLHLNNVTSGQVGFDSGFMPVAVNTTDFPTYTVTVNDTAPIWVYCKQKTPASHCGMGMVFAINSDETSGSSKTFADFSQLAIQQNGTSSNSTSNSSSTGSTGTSTGTTSGAMQLSVAGTVGVLALTASLMALL